MITKSIIIANLALSMSSCSLFTTKETIIYKQSYLDKNYVFTYCKKPIKPINYFNLDEAIKTKDLILYINYLYNNNSLCYSSLESIIKIDKENINDK